MKIQWARVVHTAVAALVGVAPFVPALVDRLGVDTTAGVWAGVIAVAAAVTRLTQIPAVEAKLNAWLKVK